MKNEKYFRKLSKKNRRLFRNNCMDFKQTMNSDWPGSFSAFIGGAFLWSGTKEGYWYWSNVSKGN